MEKGTMLVSACLLGIPCRYDGCHRGSLGFQDLFKGEQWIPVCPETLAGLPIPRPPAEIRNGDGETVLDGKGMVADKNGCDITHAFLNGAQKTLEIAKAHHVTGAVLKARSPSCGKGLIYNGMFSGRTKPGHGVTVALLLRHGIPVWTEEEWEERMKQDV